VADLIGFEFFKGPIYYYSCIVCNRTGKFTWIDEIKNKINRKLPNGEYENIEKINGKWYFRK